MKRYILFLLAAALLLTGCEVKSKEEPVDGHQIYYLADGSSARGGDMIRACHVALGLSEDVTLRAEAQAVVEQLLRQPENDSLYSPFPEGTQLQSLNIHNRQAIVDLTEEVAGLDGVELSLANYCLTLSLTALNGVDTVIVTANRRMIAQQPKQILLERDVLLSTKDDVFKTVDVTLYFLNREGALTGEKRRLELYEGQSLAENLVVELLAGPLDRELTKVIPDAFEINTVRVENGICYVNLPKSSLDLLPEDVAVQEQILWSLSESIYSIETVTELRFLMDGAEMSRFGSVSLTSVGSPPKG